MQVCLPWSQRAFGSRSASSAPLNLAVASVLSGPSVERLVEETIKVREGVEGLVEEAGERHAVRRVSASV